MNKKQKLSLLLPAIVAVLAGLIALSAVTYAWITVAVGTFTNVTPTVGGKISKGSDNLLICETREGEFRRECTLEPSYPESLKPISTKDLSHFYMDIEQDRSGYSIRFQDVSQDHSLYALTGTLYLKYQGNQGDIYLNIPELQLQSTAQILSAGRLGLKFTQDNGTVTNWLFKLDYFSSGEKTQHQETVYESNAVIEGIKGNGEPRFADDPALPIQEFFLEEKEHRKLLTMGFNEIVRVDYFLYLEGCDDACYNPMVGNAVSEETDYTGEVLYDPNNPNLRLQLGFAGEPVVSD